MASIFRWLQSPFKIFRRRFLAPRSPARPSLDVFSTTRALHTSSVSSPWSWGSTGHAKPLTHRANRRFVGFAPSILISNGKPIVSSDTHGSPSNPIRRTSSTRRVQNRSRIIMGPLGRGCELMHASFLPTSVTRLTRQHPLPRPSPMELSQELANRLVLGDEPFRRVVGDPSIHTHTGDSQVYMLRVRVKAARGAKARKRAAIRSATAYASTAARTTPTG